MVNSEHMYGILKDGEGKGNLFQISFAQYAHTNPEILGDMKEYCVFYGRYYDKVNKAFHDCDKAEFVRIVDGYYREYREKLEEYERTKHIK